MTNDEINEANMKIGNIIGPVLEGVLPEGTSAIILLCWEGDMNKLSILSRLNLLDRTLLLSVASTNGLMEVHKNAVAAQQAHTSNDDAVLEAKTTSEKDEANV